MYGYSFCLVRRKEQQVFTALARIGLRLDLLIFFSLFSSFAAAAPWSAILLAGWRQLGREDISGFFEKNFFSLSESSLFRTSPLSVPIGGSEKQKAEWYVHMADRQTDGQTHRSRYEEPCAVELADRQAGRQANRSLHTLHTHVRMRVRALSKKKRRRKRRKCEITHTRCSSLVRSWRSAAWVDATSARIFIGPLPRQMPLPLSKKRFWAIGVKNESLQVTAMLLFRRKK